MDNLIEKKVSNFIETQFPEFYRTDGPTFILFLKKYYEWMEGQQEISVPFNKGTVKFSAKNKTIIGTNTFFKNQFVSNDIISLYYDDTENGYEFFEIDTIISDTKLILKNEELLDFSSDKSLYGKNKLIKNPNYHIRRFSEYDDIDTTAEEFILYFKEHYLKNIQFTTKTNTRQLIKHSLDLYRSKGTARGLDLLFKLVFGSSIKIYNPGEDVFKTSSGIWYVPKYLEISLSKGSVNLVNKQIIGLTSGATAFAESVIRRTVKGKISDIIYISAINGNFQTGELINSSDNVLEKEERPVITGSLTEIEIDSGGTGSGFNIGDFVNIKSNSGEQAVAKIKEVSDITGTVDFELINGGYAYTPNSEIIISEKVLNVSNVSLTSNTNKYFSLFETVIQPLANIQYVNSNNLFSNLDVIQTYYSNGTFAGNGTIISTKIVNNSTGSLLITPNVGNLNVSYVTKLSNTVVANVSVFSNVTASGNLIGISDKQILKINYTANGFLNGSLVSQLNSNTLTDFANGTIEKSETDGIFNYLTLKNCQGAFSTNISLLDNNSGIYANVQNISITIGLKNILNDFYSFSGNKIYGNTFLSNGIIESIGKGSGANFFISNSFNYTEDVLFNNDYLNNFANIALNAPAYGFSFSPTANLSSNIATTLNYTTIAIGKLTTLKSKIPGTNYNIPPIVLLFEQKTYPFNRKDYIIEYSNASSSFSAGELITQQLTNARGLISFVNNSIIKIENLRLFSQNDFILSTNSITKIKGENSGTIADLNNIYVDNNSEYIGVNAEITSKTKNSKGSIIKASVEDSGFGFAEKEEVEFIGDGISKLSGFGIAKLGKYGKSKGFYKSNDGFLSDNKKLFDGIYYQDYSYEIRSSITLNKYEEMLKQIMHIPGTKYFGAFVYYTQNSNKIQSKKTNIKIS